MKTIGTMSETAKRPHQEESIGAPNTYWVPWSEHSRKQQQQKDPVSSKVEGEADT